MQIFCRDECRAVDRRAIEEYGMASIVLMENAGRGVADVLCAQPTGPVPDLQIPGPDGGQVGEPTRRLRQSSTPADSGPVVLLCGKGNNAGDGLVIARHLEIRRRDARVLFVADPAELRGDARTNYEILARTDVPILVPDRQTLSGENFRNWLDRHGQDASWIVDALLGTGASGPPRAPFDTAIAWINDQTARKLAVDLPSGFDCDTGLARGPCVEADITCTFLAMKRGFLAPNADRYTGTVHVLDIGVPRKLVESE